MSAADHLRSAAHLHGFAPSALLVGLCVGALWWARRSPWGLALLALPGTLAHELAHLLVGVVVNARPVQISLWPQSSGAGWTLGSETFRILGVFNAACVAFAPVLLLPLGWLGLMHFALPAWTAGQWALWLLFGYLCATAFFAAVPSYTDIKLGALSLLLYLVLLALGWSLLPTLRGWRRELTVSAL